MTFNYLSAKKADDKIVSAKVLKNFHFKLQITCMLKFKDKKANTADSDETAPYEPSHLDLQCLELQLLLYLALLGFK